MPTRGFDIIKVESGDEPVSLEMLKTYLEVRSDAHDSLLRDVLLIAARKRVERFLCVSLVESDITVRWEEISGSEELPYGPVQELTSVTDEDNEIVAFKREGLMGSFVGINVTRSEPTIIRYKAGYPLPLKEEPIKLAIMKLVVDDFEERKGISLDPANKLPNDWKATCRTYRRIPWTA